MDRIKVGVNGYGVIGKRVADAVHALLASQGIRHQVVHGVVRTPMLPGQSRRGRRALWLVLAAVGVLTGGALAGLWWLAGAGVLLEFVALLVVATR